MLKGHCDAVGRDYDEITKTWSPEMFIRETEQEIVDAGSRSFWGEPFESWPEGNLVGTPEQVVREDPGLHRPRAARASSRGPATTPTPRRMPLFAEQVMPEFR